MAEKKETKKETKKKSSSKKTAEEVSKPVKKPAKKLAELSLKDLRMELQKTVLQVRAGRENDTTKIRKIKKEIARKLTKDSLQK